MTPAELKRARERLKLNQRELAEALGMQRNSIVRMEIGMQPILRTTEFSVRYLLVMSKKRRGGKKRGDR